MKSLIFLRSTIALALMVIVFNSCEKDNTEPFISQQEIITVSTLAGSGSGYVDGAGATAFFNRPYGVACDDDGNIFVADQWNNCIRKITPDGEVSTLAGNGLQGFVDGDGTNAQFRLPTGVACDGKGNVYVADQGNCCIRKITSTGIVSTFAGNGNAGYEGDGNSPFIQAEFNIPSGVAIDTQGNVYVSDKGNYRVRKISSPGVVTLLAGSGLPGSADGTGMAAQFGSLAGIACDISGNVYVTTDATIRKITPAGVVTTIAGDGTIGNADGYKINAHFYYPTGLTVDSLGSIYVADQFNHRIRKISSTGSVTTLAGSVGGFADGDKSVAQFYYPTGVAIDFLGNIYVADYSNGRIRKIVIE